ncbi:4274_t:CDS:2 [Funneliformis geosporum]|uniref:4274_t:CDS:1 n=1 Tax=Funneliformis geosporum TaxID=1117311 RepID=A0A9W4SKC2_9GLOM|nr:4274_t:CDS:2 [Funneliformis geosporum]
MSKTEIECDYISEINPTDNINTLIDKLFTLLIKTQDEGKNFDETKNFLNKCIAFSTQSTDAVFNWLKVNHNESKFSFLLGIFYYYNMLILKNNNNEFKYFQKASIDYPVSQLHLGLNYIHNQKIIHRDFHSGNILCENVYDNYDIVISDLGISKLSTEVSENNNEYYGIMPYIASEIFQRQKYTETSDIYSFGMIMWELMTGRRPFWDRDYDTSLIIEICDGLRPPIDTNAPEGYIKIMQNCWHSNPNKRPSASNICDIIEQIILKEENNPTKIIKSLNASPVITNKFTSGKRKYDDNNHNDKYCNESKKSNKSFYHTDYASKALEYDV